MGFAPMSVEDLSVDPGCVLPALRTEMGREEGIELESSSAERVANEQYLAYGVGYQLEREFVAFTLVRDCREWDVRFREREGVSIHSFHFEPCALVGYDETEVANLRLPRRRVIDLVDDSVAESDPNPARTQRGQHHVFGRRTPGGSYPGLPWG